MPMSNLKFDFQIARYLHIFSSHRKFSRVQIPCSAYFPIFRRFNSFPIVNDVLGT